MLRRLSALVVVGILTAYAVLLVYAKWPHQGRVIYVVGPGHGLYVGDILDGVAWVLGMVAVVILFRRRRGPDA